MSNLSAMRKIGAYIPHYSPLTIRFLSDIPSNWRRIESIAKYLHPLSVCQQLSLEVILTQFYN